MTTPTVNITRAKDHPRFAGTGAEPPEVPATKKIDTDAARERVAATRNAKATSDRPPGRPRKTSEETTTPVIPYTNGMFKTPIAALYQQGGRLVQYVVYPIGVAMEQQATDCGTAWDEVAKSNPTVRKWLHGMTKTGAWGKLVAAHMPIAMAAFMVFGPQSFRDRLAGAVADSMESVTESNHTAQDPN